MLPCQKTPRVIVPRFQNALRRLLSVITCKRSEVGWLDDALENLSDSLSKKPFKGLVRPPSCLVAGEREPLSGDFLVRLNMRYSQSMPAFVNKEDEGDRGRQAATASTTLASYKSLRLRRCVSFLCYRPAQFLGVNHAEA